MAQHNEQRTVQNLDPARKKLEKSCASWVALPEVVSGYKKVGGERSIQLKVNSLRSQVIRTLGDGEIKNLPTDNIQYDSRVILNGATTFASLVNASWQSGTRYEREQLMQIADIFSSYDVERIHRIDGVGNWIHEAMMLHGLLVKMTREETNEEDDIEEREYHEDDIEEREYHAYNMAIKSAEKHGVWSVAHFGEILGETRTSIDLLFHAVRFKGLQSYNQERLPYSHHSRIFLQECVYALACAGYQITPNELAIWMQEHCRRSNEGGIINSDTRKFFANPENQGMDGYSFLMKLLDDTNGKMSMSECIYILDEYGKLFPSDECRPVVSLFLKQVFPAIKANEVG